MCGIAACCPPDQDAVASALRRIAHRGPDRTGAVDLATASLGVVRLAIADVAEGHQPLITEGGAVGFNGAIYNASALVRSWGLLPSTRNDGEVIWPLYQRLGLEFASQLEGMYAICIVDEERSRLVLATDPMGIKPLHLAIDGDSWFAASTIQAFPTALRGKAFRLPPGTVLASDGSRARVQPRPRRAGPLRRLLEEAVAEQIPEEVPWGSMLSGGLDSSLIAALAADRHPGIVTISVGLDGSSDLEAASAVALAIGADHHEVLVDEGELLELIDEVVLATGSPDGSTVMGGVGTFLAARAASRLGLKVLLSGEGADELFAGYEEYRLTPRDLLAAELLADQEDLGATECLRLDRCAMAHGIEARVPYLSTAVAAHAKGLPPEEKLDLRRSEPKEKLPLRRVAAELLPEEIAWRPKLGFSTGSGLMAAGGRLARQLLGETELEALRASPEWTAFARSQRLIDVDERLAAYTFSRWRALHPELRPWYELRERGLARRFMSDGSYRLPQCLPSNRGASLPPSAQVSATPGILVLASPMHVLHPYSEWANDLNRPLLAIAPLAFPPSSSFSRVAFVEEWETNAIVEQALALYRTCKFDRVVSLGEVDVLPAARIRELLSLPGQTQESALAYRDKLSMRRRAAATGIPVPAFAPVADAKDVSDFMRRHHKPAMVKPRLGGGSVGVRRIENLAEASALRLLPDDSGYLVEEAVEGPTFHVEALRVDGKTVLSVPCAYTGAGCVSHWADEGSGSWTLAADNPLFAALAKATEQVLDALPGPPDLAAHAEFILAGKELVLCEVASRCGGTPIPAMMKRRLGVDMRRLWFRLQCGLSVEIEEAQRHLAAAPLVANFGLPPRNGRIQSLPALAPPGVEGLELHCLPEEDFGGARYRARRSGDFVATWTLAAPEEASLLESIDAAAAKMEEEISWSFSATPRYGTAVATPSPGESTN